MKEKESFIKLPFESNSTVPLPPLTIVSLPAESATHSQRPLPFGVNLKTRLCASPKSSYITAEVETEDALDPSDT